MMPTKVQGDLECGGSTSGRAMHDDARQYSLPLLSDGTGGVSHTVVPSSHTLTLADNNQRTSNQAARPEESVEFISIPRTPGDGLPKRQWITRLSGWASVEKVKTTSFSLPKRPRLKGPLRAARLCILSILLPALLLTLPLYMRYRIYGRGEAFPLAASDMRLIDSHVSTTWCQRQLVEANASFNAFLMPETPQIEEEPQKTTMHRSIYLDDDMKEYWGFYLLKGSSVSVSACARWPGASLIVIRGHRHLRECAYIGQKSSEESDEMILVDSESVVNQTQGGNDAKNSKNPHRTRQVILNDKLTWNSPPRTKKQGDFNERQRGRVSTPPPTRNKKQRRMHTITPPTTISPEKLLETSTPPQPVESSSEVYDDIVQRISQMGRERWEKVLRRLSDKLVEEKKVSEETKDEAQKKDVNNRIGSANESAQVDILMRIVEQAMNADQANKASGNKKSAPTGGNDKGVEGNSTKVLLGRKGLKDRSKRRNATSSSDINLRESVNSTVKSLQIENAMREDGNVSEEKKRMVNRKRSIEEESEEIYQEVKGILQRNRRDVLQKDLGLLLDEEEDEALVEEENDDWIELEDGHVPNPDGIADDRGTFDHWDPNDRSRSEFWSSFSSSEEALLVCDGLILYMPLTPHLSCNEGENLRENGKENSMGDKTNDHHVHTDHGRSTETKGGDVEDRDNTLSYQVPANGYYFFVFNSENEVQTNFVHVHFDLRRRLYKIQDPLAVCHNATHCELPLSFLSDQKVVLELPSNQESPSNTLIINGQLANKNRTSPGDEEVSTSSPIHGSILRNDHVASKTGKESRIEGGETLLWDESYVVVTSCEPRTTLYLCFIISVPLLILLFAFQ